MPTSAESFVDHYPEFVKEVQGLPQPCHWEKLNDDASMSSFAGYRPRFYSGEHAALYALKEGEKIIGCAKVWQTESGNFCVDDFSFIKYSDHRSLGNKAYVQCIKNALAEALLETSLRATRVIYREVSSSSLHELSRLVVNERVREGVDFLTFKHQWLLKHQPRLATSDLQSIRDRLAPYKPQIQDLLLHFLEQLDTLDSIELEELFGTEGTLRTLLNNESSVDFWQAYLSKCFYLHTDQRLTLSALTPTPFLVARTLDDIKRLSESECDESLRARYLAWQDWQHHQPALFLTNDPLLQTFRNRDGLTALAFWAKQMSPDNLPYFFSALKAYPTSEARADALEDERDQIN